MAELFKATPDLLRDRVESFLKDQRLKDKEIEALKSKILARESGDLLSGVKEINGIRVLAREIDADSPKELRDYVDQIKERLGSGILLLGSKREDKVMLICAVTKDLTDRFKAGEIIGHLSGIVGGKGGGRPDMAQGGGNRPEELNHALEAIFEMVGKDLKPEARSQNSEEGRTGKNLKFLFWLYVSGFYHFNQLWLPFMEDCFFYCLDKFIYCILLKKVKLIIFS